jgi:hypothetical protein
MDCLICGGWALDYYTVHDDVWAEAGLKSGDSCCLDCLERRLDRPLALDDFPPFQVNAGAYAGAGKLWIVRREEKRRKREGRWRLRRHRQGGRKGQAPERSREAVFAPAHAVGL